MSICFRELLGSSQQEDWFWATSTSPQSPYTTRPRHSCTAYRRQTSCKNFKQSSLHKPVHMQYLETPSPNTPKTQNAPEQLGKSLSLHRQAPKIQAHAKSIATQLNRMWSVLCAYRCVETDGRGDCTLQNRIGSCDAGSQEEATLCW